LHRNDVIDVTIDGADEVDSELNAIKVVAHVNFKKNVSLKQQRNLF
jgi:ribose 5-phosphate isomerase